MKRLIGLILLALLLPAPAWAVHDNIALQREHHGVVLIALREDPNKTFDTSLVAAEQGMQNLAKALDLLIERSPFSAQKLEILKQGGRVMVVYLPGDAPKNMYGRESIAAFLPDFLSKPGVRSRKKGFLVVVWRHGIKWPVDELAAVLAHELVGHGMQHQRGRRTNIRGLDRECEAYLYHEIAIQDLGLDKLKREMIEFRQAMERHYCSDFKTFMRARRPDAMALWDVLNPDVPKLLKLFEAYLDHSERQGVTGKALAAAETQLKERRQRWSRDATPHQIYRLP